MLRRCSHASQDLLFAHADHLSLCFRCYFGTLMARTGASTDEQQDREAHRRDSGGVAEVHARELADSRATDKRRQRDGGRRVGSAMVDQ